MYKVYIAYCDLYPEQFKLGMTSKSIDKRMRELSAYGTNEQYEIDGYKPLCVFESPIKDFHFHKKFKEYRIGNDRELFSIECITEVIKYVEGLKLLSLENDNERRVALLTKERIRMANNKKSDIFSRAHCFARGMESEENVSISYRERFSMFLTMEHRDSLAVS